MGMTKQVEVRLFFDLKRYARQKSMPFTMSLAGKATVTDILKELGIPPSKELVALIDGAPSGLEAVPPHQGEVTIFPTVLGG